MNDTINKDITYHNDMMISLFLSFLLFGKPYIHFYLFLVAQIDDSVGKKGAFGFSDLTLYFRRSQLFQWCTAMGFIYSRTEQKSKHIFDFFNCSLRTFL